MSNQNFSRRNFLKPEAISSVAITGVASLTSCETNSPNEKKEPFPLFKGDNYSTEDRVTGLLFSQVGYETGLPVRIVIRLSKKDLLPESANCILIPTFQTRVFRENQWADNWIFKT